MNHMLPLYVGLLLAPCAALAGGLDRTDLPLDVLFEPGTVVNLSFAGLEPKVSGVYPLGLAFAGGTAETERMSGGFSAFGLAVKADLGDRLSYALMISQPFSADARYRSGFYNGLQARWTSRQLTALVKYDLTDKVAVYGGLRYLQSRAEIGIPVQLLSPPITPVVLGPYTATTKADGSLGYLVGASYQMPEIGLRGSLTYQSAITHDLTTDEAFAGLAGGATLTSSTRITMPHSVTLDLQTGIGADTVLFGSVRWAQWSRWQVSPAYFGRSITGFDTDVMTYQLGIGQRISDAISIYGRLGYEKATGGTAQRLSPTDGRHSLSVGAAWTEGRLTVSGGVDYLRLGDAVDDAGVQFAGNDALGLGLSVQVKF